MDKFQIQENEYSFPYHYLTSLNNNVPSIDKRLSWGYEYLTYVDFITKYIEEEINPKSLLDIGCGDGFLINNLVFDNSKKINGIDLSEKAISFAKAFSNGYEFYCKDIFDVKEKFNTVCLIEVIEHIPDGELSSFIDESFKKVDVGGYLIISVPTTVDPVQKKHFRHYDESLLNKHINHENFKIIDQVRLYKKSKLLEKMIKFSQKHKSKKLRKIVWKWHKKNTYFSDTKNGKHLVTIYRRTK